MYQIFKYISGKPIQLIGMFFAIVLIIIMINVGFTHIGTLLGFNTKENLIIKNEKTTTELNKAIDILENNQMENKISDEVKLITGEKIKQDIIISNQLRYNETKDLEEFKNTIVEEPNIVEKIITVEKEVYTSPRVVYLSKKLNNRQKMGMNILKDRANKLKGSKR